MMKKETGINCVSCQVVKQGKLSHCVYND